MAATIAFGLAIGLSVGALGGGGSVLAVPVLVYLLGETVPEATTISLAVVAAGALAGGVAHRRAGRICWRHAAAFTTAALPGVLAGTLASAAVTSGALLAAFAGILLAAAAATWSRAGAASAGARRSACPPLRPARVAAVGLAVGLMTGFFGVGGGFLIVPALAIALAFATPAAIGTSLAIIAATSLLGLAAHLLAGSAIDPDVTAVMAAACAAGAAAGAALATRLPQRTLGHGLAVLLVAVAAYLIVSVAVLGGPPAA